ncbi:hypothetical protein PR048_027413 [Dryococelus australis]|uniref:Uncharacterized protein n=1 Tax=Dryococelus australis TaxID=614101 RepID=A0ABQ9GGM6_9NEOP|nr:hypothetical protein PR048_027413 [Dryococelus australis]
MHPRGNPAPKVKTIRATLTRTPSVSSLLRERQIWAALNIEALRVNDGEAIWVWSSAGTQGRRKREIPEIARRHDSHMRKSGGCPAGNQTRKVHSLSPRWPRCRGRGEACRGGTEGRAARRSRRRRGEVRRVSVATEPAVRGRSVQACTGDSPIMTARLGAPKHAPPDKRTKSTSVAARSPADGRRRHLCGIAFPVDEVSQISSLACISNATEAVGDRLVPPEQPQRCRRSHISRQRLFHL